MLQQTATGLYRKGRWAFVDHNDGCRTALPREQYESEGYRPEFDALQTEDDFHERALGHRYGDND